MRMMFCTRQVCEYKQIKQSKMPSVFENVKQITFGLSTIKINSYARGEASKMGFFSLLAKARD